MWGIPLSTIALALVAAAGYALATIGMKLGAGAMTLLATALIAGGMIAAALSEITILRSADLGVVYLTILCLETLLVLGTAYMLGERLSLRQVGGAVLLLAGLALVAT